MSTEFEKFIRKNRSDFDDVHPSDKVWKDLEKKFVRKKDVRRFTLRDIYKWSAVAAIFFMTLTSVYFLFIKKYSHEIPTVKTGNPESPSRLDNFNGLAIEHAAEFKEASEAVENRQKELRTAIANNPELYKKFQDDLNTLDSSYRILREQAAQSVNGDVLIKAMIQNLQLQSELLGRQLMIIKEFKTTKTQQNEKNI
ncbi:MAG TPA: hypothetical protein VFT15_15060 [Chitinophagaceae bacterium]|nr:hypothetical protein [Chitinophagaceae bacterium]